MPPLCKIGRRTVVITESKFSKMQWQTLYAVLSIAAIVTKSGINVFSWTGQVICLSLFKISCFDRKINAG